MSNETFSLFLSLEVVFLNRFVLLDAGIVRFQLEKTRPSISDITKNKNLILLIFEKILKFLSKKGNPQNHRKSGSFPLIQSEGLRTSVYAKLPQDFCK